MSQTRIIECDCMNGFQDALHGRGRRVGNRTADKERVIFRCTVCGKEHMKGEAAKKASKK